MARTPKMSQSEILRRLGVPQSEWKFLNGNGLAQRAANQAAAAKGLPQPFNPSFAASLIQDLIPLGVIAGAAAPGVIGAAAGTGARPALSASGAGKAVAAGSVIGAVGSNISSVTDFLSYIAWLFHPLNFLRVAEFSTGVGLLFFGLHIVLKQAFRSGRTHRGGISGIIGSMFPAYRARRMGRAKGRLDRSYQQARREARAQP